MRLIDANALITEYDRVHIGEPGKARKLIEDAPTVDAVEVVRKPVKGYEGYYEVDQFGRVFSVERVISVDDNGRKYVKTVSGKQMKQCLKNNGYKSVSLTKGGETKSFYVHRLVAEAFIQNPDNLPMVNHKDEDKTNNFMDNLEWCEIKTLEGTMIANAGDYIIQGVNGEIYPCKADIFDKTYEAVP